MVGNVVHHGVIVSDIDEISSYYTNVLGFEQVDSRSVSGDAASEILGVADADISVVMLDANGFLLELIEYNSPVNENANKKVEPHDVGVAHFAIQVEDLDMTFDEVKDDTEYISEPKTLESLGGVKAVYLKDPDGNMIELVEFPE